MRNITYLFPFAIIFIFALSCSTGPDFDRDNEIDPAGKNYIPKPPSGLNYTMDEEGNISLFWQDRTDYELGYRIYKSLGKNESFRLLKELEKNTTSFTDTSKIFAFPTQYHIVSFSNGNESDTLSININFGQLNNFKAEYLPGYENLTLSWENEFFFIDVDGYLLSKKTDKDQTFNQFAKLPTSSNEITISTPDDGFKHEFRLTAYIIYDSDTTRFESNIIPVITTEPRDLQLKLLTPDSMKISWVDISDFEDSFQLTVRDQSGIETFTIPKNDTSYTVFKDFILNDEVKVELTAFNSEFASPKVQKSLKTNLPSAEIDQIQSISKNELSLSVSDLSVVSREKKVFRKTETSSYQEVGIIEKGSSTFIDNNVDPINYYTYYVSAKLSEDSEPLNLHFNKKLNLFNHIEQTRSLTNIPIDKRRVAFRHDSEKLIFQSDFSSSEITIFDFLSEETLQIFNTSSTPRNIAFDSAEENIYLLNSVSREINIFDFETGEIKDTIQIQYPAVGNFELLNLEKLLVTVHSDYQDYKLISIDLTNNEVDEIKSFGLNQPIISLDRSGEKVLINYEVGTSYYYELYQIDINRELALIESNQQPFYASNFSADLDTAIVLGSNDLSLYDMSTGERVWNFPHYSITNYCCSNVNLLPDKMIVLQSQGCSLLIDTKIEQNPIVDIYCDSSDAARQGLLSAAGLIDVNINNQDFILDLRRSHSSGQNSFIDIFTLKEEWKEVFSEQ